MKQVLKAALITLILFCWIPLHLAELHKLRALPQTQPETAIPLSLNSRRDLPLQVSGMVLEASGQRMVVRFDWQVSTDLTLHEDLIAFSWQSGTHVTAVREPEPLMITLDYYSEGGFPLGSHPVWIDDVTPFCTRAYALPLRLPHGTSRKTARSGHAVLAVEAAADEPFHEVAFSMRYYRPPLLAPAYPEESMLSALSSLYPRNFAETGMPYSAAVSHLAVSADGSVSVY